MVEYDSDDFKKLIADTNIKLDKAKFEYSHDLEHWYEASYSHIYQIIMISGTELYWRIKG